VTELYYLASPYHSGKGSDPAVRIQRYEATVQAVGNLMRAGYMVFSPIVHSHAVAELCGLPLGFEFWKQIDEEFIRRCDGVIVLMLDGWEESPGVTAEVTLANKLNKYVIYLEAE
jgi:hypothetical protein